MKKFIAVLLAMLMVFSAMTVCAYAAADKAAAEEETVTTEEEEETDAIVEAFKGLFDGMDGKETVFQFATENFSSSAGFVFIMPLLVLLQGLLCIVFVVLDVLNLDLADLGISF